MLAVLRINAAADLLNHFKVVASRIWAVNLRYTLKCGGGIRTKTLGLKLKHAQTFVDTSYGDETFPTSYLFFKTKIAGAGKVFPSAVHY